MKAPIVILLCCLLLQGSHTLAQHPLTSENSIPTIGTKIFKQQTIVVAPGTPGIGKAWDFSNIAPLDKAYEITYSLSADSLTYDIEDNQTRYTYQLRNDSLLYWGHDNYLVKTEYTQPELKLRFPFSYGDSVRSRFEGTGEYCHKLSLPISGLSSTRADAKGTLLMPGKRQIDGVLRTCTRQAYEKQGTDSVSMDIHTYSWYAPEKSHPIVETMQIFLQNNSGVPTLAHTASFYYYTWADESLPEENLPNDGGTPNTGIKGGGMTAEEFLTSCKLYPMPVASRLTVEYEMKEAGDISFLLTNNGGMVRHLSPARHTQAGLHTQEIPMENLETGVYTLHIQIDQLTVKINVLKN